MKGIILIIAFLIGLVIISSLIIVNFTGSVVNGIGDKYSYTRALCDGNKCIDYYIECENGSVIGMKDISGLAIFEDNWTDNRKDIGDFCS